MPCHAGDTLTLTGEVTADDGAERVISVVGRCGLGDHVTATVRLVVTGEPLMSAGRGRDRRHRRDRVLEELRPQRAPPRRRGDHVGAGRCRTGCRRRGRPGHLHHGRQRRDRRRPRTRGQRAAVLQPDRLRRRRRLRDRAAGGDGRRHRNGGRRGLLPRAQRAVRPSLRPGGGRTGRQPDHRGDRQRLALSDGPRHAGRDGRDDRPPVHARVRGHQRGLRPGHGRGPRATLRATPRRGSSAARSRSPSTRNRGRSPSRSGCSTAARRAMAPSPSWSPASTAPATCRSDRP